MPAYLSGPLGPHALTIQPLWLYAPRVAIKIDGPYPPPVALGGPDTKPAAVAFGISG